MDTRVVVLGLYRNWIRAVYRFPEKRLHSKLRYNVREVFELYKREDNITEIENLVQRGYDDLGAFRQFEKLDTHTLDVLMSSAIGRNSKKSTGDGE
jgi:hypothetical protein